MKWFYIISLLVVTALFLSPFWLLKERRDNRSIETVVSYGTYGAKIKSMDPATCGDTTSAAMQGGIHEGLYTYHYLKRPVEVIPLLADGMPEVSEDGMTFTIRIKKGIKYHRNPCFGHRRTRTVTAGDFVLAFKRVADFHVTTSLSYAFLEGRIVGLKEYRDRTEAYPKGDFSRYDREQIEGVRALDDHALEIRLTKRFPQFLYVLALNSYAPVPREVVSYHLATRGTRSGKRKPIPPDERSPEIHAREAVVGTGPYMLAEWVEGQKVTLVRNPDYRQDFYPAEGADQDRRAGLLADARKPVPFIDERQFLFVGEPSAAWKMFEKMQVDLAGVPRDMFHLVITDGRDLAARYRSKGVSLTKYRSPAVYWFAFNMDDRILGASKSLRQGLCLSYDVENHIKVLINGRGVRALNTVPSSFKGHKRAGPGPCAHMDLDAARAKIARARKELIAAGAIKPGDDIPELDLDLGGREEFYRRMGEFAQTQFRKVGVRLKVNLNDWPTLQKKVHNKQCQIYSMGWHADYPDAENFLQLYYSPNIRNGTNNTNYANPEFDKLFERAGVLPDVEDRIPLYVKMIRMISEDCPVLLLSEPESFLLTHAWVRNVKPHPIGYGMGKYRRIDVRLRAAMQRRGGR